MSEGPSMKKQKMHHYSKKPNYHIQKNRKHFMEPGQRGFIATCNFRERDCIRECYNILNQYSDELYGVKTKVESAEHKDNGDNNDEADITDTLEKEIAAAKSDSKEHKHRFQMVDTGANNCLFIKTMLKDPVELGNAIAKDIAESKSRKTRHLLRLVPIDTVCHANMKDIIDSSGALFDRHFLKEPKTFSIAFNKRCNNDIKRDDVIKELADLVASKNAKNKVDLKNAETTVVVEVIKGLCCLGVVPDYLKLKRYNLSELANKTTQNEGNGQSEVTSVESADKSELTSVESGDNAELTSVGSTDKSEVTSGVESGDKEAEDVKSSAE